MNEEAEALTKIVDGNDRTINQLEQKFGEITQETKNIQLEFQNINENQTDLLYDMLLDVVTKVKTVTDKFNQFSEDVDNLHSQIDESRELLDKLEDSIKHPKIT